VDMGGQSLSTGSARGRMFSTLMAGCAELERNLIAERTASVLAHKKQQGKVYNHTLYGFDRVGDRLVVAVEEMAMVRLMQERRVRRMEPRHDRRRLQHRSHPRQERRQMVWPHRQEHSRKFCVSERRRR
jgi:DNA invertase Pin-like site-specific DNA recombinase